jgi:hypothetical protein
MLSRCALAYIFSTSLYPLTVDHGSSRPSQDFLFSVKRLRQARLRRREKVVPATAYIIRNGHRVS